MFRFAGPSSYKQHGYRMLRIWVDSLGPDLDPIEELIDSLNTIEKNSLAGNVIWPANFGNSNISGKGSWTAIVYGCLKADSRTISVVHPFGNRARLPFELGSPAILFRILLTKTIFPRARPGALIYRRVIYFFEVFSPIIIPPIRTRARIIQSV